jgi:hypothetical protein
LGTLGVAVVRFLVGLSSGAGDHEDSQDVFIIGLNVHPEVQKRLSLFQQTEDSFPGAVESVEAGVADHSLDGFDLHLHLSPDFLAAGFEVWEGALAHSSENVVDADLLTDGLVGWGPARGVVFLDTFGGDIKVYHSFFKKACFSTFLPPFPFLVNCLFFPLAIYIFINLLNLVFNP